MAENTIIDDNKFNDIMPETTDRVLCVRVHKPISAAGYTDNFLARLEDMVTRHDAIRLLVYFQEFQGWERAAALDHFGSRLVYGGKVVRMALVNPPVKEIMQQKIKDAQIRGETCIFAEEDLQKALEWVQQ